MAIFAEVTEIECIIERHLCDVLCQKALIYDQYCFDGQGINTSY